MDIESFIAQVIYETEATAPRFADLAKPGTTVFPIPFFGRIDTAIVLTVGVNPSVGEFEGRGWPDAIDPSYLAGRLLRYFEPFGTPPHQWFDAWQEALLCLGVSYRSGEVAHLDISPRATIAMSQIDPGRFLEMARHDVKWLFSLLDRLTRPDLFFLRVV